MNADGTDLRALQPNDNGYNADNVDAAWVPGHDQLEVLQADSSTILVFNAAGTSLRASFEIPVIKNQEGIFSPNRAYYANLMGGLSFDPTGQVMYYSGEPGDGSPSSLYSMGTTGTGGRRTTTGLNIEAAPAVLP